jgi:hypothetical protein
MRENSCKLGEKNKDKFVTALMINDGCAIKQSQPGGHKHLSALYFYLQGRYPHVSCHTI